jgi:hypothetical protein
MLNLVKSPRVTGSIPAGDNSFALGGVLPKNDDDLDLHTMKEMRTGTMT